jgi:hypothetical protein
MTYQAYKSFDHLGSIFASIVHASLTALAKAAAVGVVRPPISDPLEADDPHHWVRVLANQESVEIIASTSNWYTRLENTGPDSDRNHTN